MARPQHVEIPRSLVEVVIHWNVAIHVFLKNCKLVRKMRVYVVDIKR